MPRLTGGCWYLILLFFNLSLLLLLLGDTTPVLRDPQTALSYLFRLATNKGLQKPCYNVGEFNTVIHGLTNWRLLSPKRSSSFCERHLSVCVSKDLPFHRRLPSGKIPHCHMFIWCQFDKWLLYLLSTLLYRCCVKQSLSKLTLTFDLTVHLIQLIKNTMYRFFLIYIKCDISVMNLEHLCPALFTENRPFMAL